MAVTRTEVISERYWNSQQSWHYEQLQAWSLYGRNGGYATPTKLRVLIESNHYDFQSSGKVERWDGAKWQQVVYRAGVTLNALHNNYGKPSPISTAFKELPPAAKALFEKDCDEMLAEAYAVLS